MVDGSVTQLPISNKLLEHVGKRVLQNSLFRAEKATLFGANLPVKLQLVILQCDSFWRTAKKSKSAEVRLHTNNILVDPSQYYR